MSAVDEPPAAAAAAESESGNVSATADPATASDADVSISAAAPPGGDAGAGAGAEAGVDVKVAPSIDLSGVTPPRLRAQFDGGVGGGAVGAGGAVPAPNELAVIAGTGCSIVCIMMLGMCWIVWGVRHRPASGEAVAVANNCHNASDILMTFGIIVAVLTVSIMLLTVYENSSGWYKLSAIGYLLYVVVELGLLAFFICCGYATYIINGVEGRTDCDQPIFWANLVLSAGGIILFFLMLFDVACTARTVRHTQYFVNSPPAAAGAAADAAAADKSVRGHVRRTSVAVARVAARTTALVTTSVKESITWLLLIEPVRHQWRLGRSQTLPVEQLPADYFNAAADPPSTSAAAASVSLAPIAESNTATAAGAATGSSPV